MPDRAKFVWLFFQFSGRISRLVYLLGFLLMWVVMGFPLYQFLRVPPDSGAAQAWSFVFMATLLAFLWSHIAFSIKRLHDLDRPGIFAVALFIPVISLVAFVALCIMPGTDGANSYGRRTDATPDGA